MSMREQLKAAVESMIKPLRSRVYNIISRAVLDSANDAGKMQVIKVNVLAGEVRSDVEYFQDFGFTSVPLPGAEALIVCPQGNREHMIAVKVGDRTVRLKGLAAGETAIYTNENNRIIIKANGDIDLKNENDFLLDVGKDLKGTIAENIDLEIKKIKLSNGADEVIDLLIQEIDALIAEPFIINKATFTLLKTKLTAFKV